MRGAVHALLQETFPGGASRWRRFRNPVRVIEARRLSDVVPALAAVEEEVERGLDAVGFLAYEASPAFDAALEARASGPLPLTWWGLFAGDEEAGAPGIEGGGPLAELAWRALLERERHEQAVRAIRDAIARGDTYQVNFTFPLEAAFSGDAFALFAALVRAQRARHAAYLDTGRFAICSVSPELFFTLEGERIVSRPMKGTARRGRYPAEDRRRLAALVESAKDRAENVMIVDMVRNDLGRIARRGSVVTERLFEVETYPTVHQMTSTVAARTPAPLVEILRALFPAASITGAPKISASRIIRRLEAAPRGVYTGALGHLGPRRRAHFNVAIRTATVDRLSRSVRYGTGGGIVWDSEPEAEYEECRTKAFVLGAARPPFALLETLRWRPRSGYFLLDRHLERLAASAVYFGFPRRSGEALRRLEEAARDFGGVATRVRLVLDSSGRLHLEAGPLPCAGRTQWTIGLDEQPIDSADVFWFHKTTNRQAHEAALRRRPDCDEVVLWNERRELTEATRANLVVKVGGEYLTPPVESGLLAGTYRAELVARRRLREEVLPLETFETADEIFLINSVRGWIRARRRPRAGRSDRMAGAPMSPGGAGGT